jgi:SWI2/SNF2 ATPase
MCKELLRQTPQQAGDREELRALLDRASGGVIFTTLQKFAPEEGRTDYPPLTDRRNVVVIADEAHRSQYGFRAKIEIERKTGEISYGFAKHLRDALPNASFIEFTGTPIEKDDVNRRRASTVRTSRSSRMISWRKSARIRRRTSPLKRSGSSLTARSGRSRHGTSPSHGHLPNGWRLRSRATIPMRLPPSRCSNS